MPLASSSVTRTTIWVANTCFQERLNRCESTLHTERGARRRCETLADELEAEVAHLRADAEKAEVRREAEKEQLRVKETAIRRLERKLDDKRVEMDDCVEELKRAHRASQSALQTQLEELKRKCMK